MQYTKKDFYYDLPEERIAQTPAMPRDSSRLLVYRRETKSIENKIFRDIEDELQAGDLLVVNNTKVIPARMYAKTAHGGVVEILLLNLTISESHSVSTLLWNILLLHLSVTIEFAIMML